MDEQQQRGVSPLTLFYSYAHEDELLRNELEKHLSLLHQQGLISAWHDRQILAGAEWAADIDQHLESASIILLLISSDFLASSYCYDIEMTRALERHQRGEARVIPIILRPCDWRSAPFGHLQCLPRDGKSLTEWGNQDAAFRDIAQGLRRAIEQRKAMVPPVPRLTALDPQNRMRLLKRVRATWIEGVLEHSLHQAALITLDLQEQPDALANPWQLAVQETNLPPRPLPAGTSIVQVYDEAEGELLILGEPGAGKTTLLLELARTLLQRAEGEKRHRLPVVFNLSSWAQERQPLAEWLVVELWTKYHVPLTVGKAWIDSDQVLPLLDGLDEVAESAQAACVQAINAYYQRHLEKGVAPLVVCCRSKEYAALPTRVTLRCAVSIQPLTGEQIEAYLQSTKGQLEGLRQALHHDPDLYELAHRPLMLSVFTLAYQGAGPEELPTEGTLEVHQRQVFASYVERMLSRRRVSKHASREQMLRWLMFLATQMQLHDQTVFFLEHLQPDWLADRRRQLLYQLSIGLVFGLGFGLFGWLVYGPVGALVLVLIGGLFGLERQIQPGEVLTWSWGKARRVTIGGLVVVLLFGLFVVLRFRLVGGLIAGLVGGLLLMLPLVLLGGLSTNQLDKRLRLRPNQGIWSSVRNGLVSGLLYGLVGGLLYGLVGVLLFGLVGGLGFRVLVVLLYGLGFGLIAGLLYGQGFGLIAGLVCGLYFGPLVGLIAGLNFGLGAFFQHFALRFWLWRANCLPRNVIAVLDEAAERLLLRRVGGGYLFVHRLLLDYFASLEAPSPQKASAVSASIQKTNEKR